MVTARKHQINLSETLYYHCIGRCVRRAFLYGDDPLTQRNYNHRKTWLINQLKALCSVFSIRICAYAVMSNHYHLVLRVDKEAAAQLSDKEIILRYKQIPLLRMHGILKVIDEEKIDEGSFTSEQIAAFREKLTNISSFMAALNEFLARLANKEDSCKGSFWEARFKSMALLDDAALLTCMAYVDLNPVRACLANSLEESDFTSIQERLFSQQTTENQLPLHNPGLKEHLGIFATPNSPEKLDIPCTWEEYHRLVQWTGQQIRQDKKGYLSLETSSLLNQLSVHPETWIANAKSFETRYSWLVGSFEKINAFLKKSSRQWVKGINKTISSPIGTSKREAPMRV